MEILFIRTYGNNRKCRQQQTWDMGSILRVGFSCCSIFLFLIIFLILKNCLSSLKRYSVSGWIKNVSRTECNLFKCFDSIKMFAYMKKTNPTEKYLLLLIKFQVFVGHVTKNNENLLNFLTGFSIFSCSF